MRLYKILGGITSPRDGHPGWFIGRRVFRSKGWHWSKPNISCRRKYSV